MKKLIITFALFGLVIFSCKTYKSTLPNYSKTVAEPAELMKNYIVSKDVPSFETVIVNDHGWRHEIYSNFEKLNDTLKISTHIIYGSRMEADTSMIFSIEEFIEKLDFEISYANSQITIAGNYQSILVKRDTLKNVFYTRQAFGLMSLLQEGKSNIIKTSSK